MQPTLPEAQSGADDPEPLVAAVALDRRRRRDRIRSAAGPGGRGRVRDHLRARLAAPGIGGDGDRGARRGTVLRRAHFAAEADQAGATPGFRANLFELNGAVGTLAAGETPSLASTRPVTRLDILVVSVDSTSGWRAAAGELAGVVRPRRRHVASVSTGPVAQVRTFPLTDFVAGAARPARTARRAIQNSDPAAIVYCSVTAALLWPRPGAIWLDTIAAENRPGRHGVWQRAVERRRLAGAPLVLAMSERSLAPLRGPPTRTWSWCRCRSNPRTRPQRTGRARCRCAGLRRQPGQARLDFILAAWSRARREDEKLVVAGIDRAGSGGRASSSRAAWPRPNSGRCFVARGCSWPPRAARTTGSRRSRRSPTAACW